MEMMINPTETQLEKAILAIAESRALANAAGVNMFEAAAAAWGKDYGAARAAVNAGREQVWVAVRLATRALALAEEEGDEVQMARARAAWDRAAKIREGLWSFRTI